MSNDDQPVPLCASCGTPRGTFAHFERGIAGKCLDPDIEQMALIEEFEHLRELSTRQNIALRRLRNVMMPVTRNRTCGVCAFASHDFLAIVEIGCPDEWATLESP
jgi:hypothetical protein